MPRRVVLPAELVDRPFSVREAAAAGVGRGRLAGPDLETPFRGVRRAAPCPVDDPVDATIARCRDLLPVLLPGQFFSHITAALLWNCPLPAPTSAADLHVTSPKPRHAPRRVGVSGHQVSDMSARRASRYGLPVNDAASVFLQLGPLLSLDDLVAVGDHLILIPHVLDLRDIRPYATLDELVLRAEAGHGRGRKRTLEALTLVRQGAESRPETLVRLLLGRSQLPEPELNVEIVGMTRRWRYRADIVYRRWKTIVEYDGDQHRTSTHQYEKDIRRFDDFADDGWRVIRVRKRGVFVDPADTVVRVTSALVASGWTPRC